MFNLIYWACRPRNQSYELNIHKDGLIPVLSYFNLLCCAEDEKKLYC